MIRFAYILALLGFLGLVGAKFDKRSGFTSLIRFSSARQETRLSVLKTLPIAAEPAESGGYDGQFYAQIAVDPLLNNPEFVGALDSPAYRAHRIFIPAIASVVGGGNAWRTLQAYALINVVCWIALAWLLRTWIKGSDWVSFARWSGCMFSMGIMESVRQSLVDLPALLLLALGIHLYTRSKTNFSTLFLALANLAKETSVLAALALNATDCLQRGKRLAALLRIAVAVVPLGIWWLYVDRQFASIPNDGLGNFTWPFVGMWFEAKTCLQAMFRADFDGRFSFGILAVIGLITQSCSLWLRRDMNSPWWRVGAAYTLLLPFLGLWVWSGYWAACRALLPLTIAFNLLLPANGKFWPWWVVGNATVLHALWRFV